MTREEADAMFDQNMKNLREARRIVRLHDRPDRDDILDTLEWAESRLRHHAALPSEPPALVALRQAWEAGFTLCRSYGDNHHHFDGEQKERRWLEYVRAIDAGDVPPLPTAAPAPETRPESGPMQFGDDWTGVFLRGDSAGWLGFLLGMVADGKQLDALTLGTLRGYAATLSSCEHGSDRPAPQRAMLIPAALAPSPETVSPQPVNVTQTTDAKVWADEWCRIAREIETAKDGRVVIDEGWMLSWFANAIMVGYDEGRRYAPETVSVSRFVERCSEIRNGSPNAFYDHVDKFCKAWVALSPPETAPKGGQ